MILKTAHILLLLVLTAQLCACSKDKGCTGQRDFNGKYQVFVQKFESQSYGGALETKKDTSYNGIMTISCSTCPYEIVMTDSSLFSENPLKIKTYQVLDKENSCNTHAKSGENDPYRLDITPESFHLTYDFRSKSFLITLSVTGSRIK